MKSPFTVTIAASAALAIFLSATTAWSQQVSYSGAWVKEMADSMEATYGLMSDADVRLKRLEKSLKDQSAELSANPGCSRLDCSELLTLARKFADTDSAIRASRLLAIIATRQ